VQSPRVRFGPLIARTNDFRADDRPGDVRADVRCRENFVMHVGLRVPPERHYLVRAGIGRVIEVMVMFVPSARCWITTW
jgi:hypothetical protein